MISPKITVSSDVIYFSLRGHIIYDIALADFVAYPEDWIRQLSGKSWMNSRLMAEIVVIVENYKNRGLNAV